MSAPSGASNPAPAPRTALRDVGVVIVAGGSGSRADTGDGELKQFRWVAGKPMLLHSVQTFMARPDVVSVVCVLPRRYAGDPPPWLFQCDLDRLALSVGGKTRGESVANGLDDLPDEAEIVRVDADGMIVRTVDREHLWRAQTPQGFSRRVIVDVHRRARADRIAATDDAALCERYGIPVRIVRGSERALKVTDPV